MSRNMAFAVRAPAELAKKKKNHKLIHKIEQ